jgi:hypothetical protein
MEILRKEGINNYCNSINLAFISRSSFSRFAASGSCFLGFFTGVVFGRSFSNSLIANRVSSILFFSCIFRSSSDFLIFLNSLRSLIELIISNWDCNRFFSPYTFSLYDRLIYSADVAMIYEFSCL